jgi:FMN phosphatase YigB (HAD superfamily)
LLEELPMNTPAPCFDAVLLDLDGTLLPLDFDQFLPRYLTRLGRFYLDVLGVDIVPLTMQSLPRVLASDGRATNADLVWPFLAEKLGVDRGTLERTYAELIARDGEWLGQGITPDPAAATIVEICREHGIKVAMATNPIFPRVMIDERARWAGLDTRRFDLVTCLDRMRSCKPSRSYYREVAHALGVDPAACLMVGNDLTLDLEPAAAIGMRTYFVDGPHALRGESSYRPDHTGTLAGVLDLLGKEVRHAAVA